MAYQMFPHTFPIHPVWWVILVLTKYAQLLLYISYEQSDLYMLPWRMPRLHVARGSSHCWAEIFSVLKLFM